MRSIWGIKEGRCLQKHEAALAQRFVDLLQSITNQILPNVLKNRPTIYDVKWAEVTQLGLGRRFDQLEPLRERPELELAPGVSLAIVDLAMDLYPHDAARIKAQSEPERCSPLATAEIQDLFFVEAAIWGQPISDDVWDIDELPPIEVVRDGIN